MIKISNYYRGFSGWSGISGYSGVSGYSGYCGIQGFCGPSGISGVSGYRGFCGPQGACGPIGISGYSGYCGIQGFCGPSGPIGVSGYSGYCGIQGFCGPSGISGVSGYRGFCGPQGACGLSGVNTTNTFLQLTDAPSSYTGFTNSLIKVNTTTNGLEFIPNDKIKYDNATGSLGIGGIGQTINTLNSIKTTSLTAHNAQLGLYDDSAVATGIGGLLQFGGNYSGTTLTTWAGIQGVKENSTSGNYAGQLHFFARKNGTTFGSNGPQMVITSAGLVGINNTSPISMIDISNNVNDSTTSSIRISNVNTGNNTITYFLASNSTGGLSMGKVGTGATNYSGYGSTGDSFIYSSAGGGSDLNIINSYSSGNIKMFAGGNATTDIDLIIYNNGNVGINNNVPNEKLDVNGNIKVRESNTIKFAGTGVSDSKFSVGYNATSNTLDFRYIG